MRPKLASRSRLYKELDAETSKIVRAIWTEKTGGMCPFGCGREIECAFHFIRKSRSLKMRWDLRNVVGACIPCNGYMEHAEGPFWTWYARTYGIEQMEAIQRESHGRALWSRSDLTTMLWETRAKRVEMGLS